MSSKSKRNQSSKKARRPRRSTSHGADAAAPQAAGDAAKAGAEHHSPLDIPDDYVHAPKNTSKLRFVLMIGLLIFMLIIFLIPDALQGTARSARGEEEGFIWTHPSDGTVVFSQTQFVLEERAFDDAFKIDPFLRLGLGMEVDGGTADDQEIARLLVLEGLARDAGLHVSDGDLIEYLGTLVEQRYGGTNEIYLANVQRLGGARRVEGLLRRCLLIRRYLDLLGHLANVPDPGRLQELWDLDREEQAFDYVRLEVEGLRDEARGELPDAAGLAAWFEGLGEDVRADFQLPERRSAAIAVYRPEAGMDVAALLEAHPASAGADPEQAAQDYYDRVFYVRFRRPEEAPEDVPEEGEGGEVEAEPEAQPPSEYLSFDEVRDVCLVEAPVYASLVEWLGFLVVRRGAGEEVDFAAEAASFGLGLDAVAPATRNELETREGLGGPSLAIAVYQAEEGGFAPTVQLFSDALAVVRVEEIFAAAMPPVEDIQDELEERWIEERMHTLAIERLAEVRDGFPELVVDEEEAPPVPQAEDVVRRAASAEAFGAAVAAAGLEVQSRDWRDKGGRQAPAGDDPVAGFFGRHREFNGMEQDELGRPVLDAAGEYAYLVRLAGKRPVPLEKMNPGEYQNYMRRTAQASQQEVKGELSWERLRDLHGARLYSENEEGDEPAEDEASG